MNIPSSTNLKWFGVRTIFTGRNSDALYEERVTLWRASDHGEAISKAEREATDYAEGGIKYLGFAQSYEIFEDEIEEGVEVFSLYRSSELTPEEYLDAFFNTGTERESAPLDS